MVAPSRLRESEDELARPAAAVRDLQQFLQRGNLEVFDVVRGAGPLTRRLVVGDAGTDRPTYVVGLAAETGGGDAVESESRHLRELARRLRPRLLATVPTPVGSIEVGRHVGAVFSAVPGTRVKSPRPRETDLRSPGAVLEWLTMLWEDTAGGTAPVEIGAAASDALTARFSRSLAAAPTLRTLESSRNALAGARTARTMSHGCLCPVHVHIRAGTVVGVDDWSLARFGADPLRDLGGWVVESAGSGLGSVMVARGKVARSLRDMLVRGLTYWGIPATRWRDVLVLCLAESAVSGLARNDASALQVLTGLSSEAIPDSRVDGVRT